MGHDEPGSLQPAPSLRRLGVEGGLGVDEGQFGLDFGPELASPGEEEVELQEVAQPVGLLPGPFAAAFTLRHGQQGQFGDGPDHEEVDAGPCPVRGP